MVRKWYLRFGVNVLEESMRRVLLFLLVGMAAADAGAALPARTADGEPVPSLAPMLERTTPAVVNIATYTTVQVRNPLLEDPFFRRFFNVPDERRYKRTQSAGSGVVVDAGRGYIVTNNHVVAHADEITVTLSDGRSLDAQLVGTDPQVDLAVLEVKPEDLTEIGFADSGGLRVGDFVVAVGNPFGLNQTVTSGIVSALGRSGLGIEGYEDFIQTDASINPGNSGGALVNLNGDLVGINTAILAPTGSSVGIGFAIPANMVRAVMTQIISHGEVRRGYLGLAVQPLNVELADAFGLDRQDGVVVVEVEPGSAADEAGIKAGDIVLRVGKRRIRRITDFHSQTAVIFVGSDVDMQVLRNGKARQLTLKVREDNMEKVGGEHIDQRLVGTKLQNFRNQDDTSLGAGVLVTEVDENSVAWRYGLRPGDVIVAVNRQAIRDLTDFRDAAQPGAGRQLLLRVYRSGQFGYIAIR